MRTSINQKTVPQNHEWCFLRQKKAPFRNETNEFFEPVSAARRSFFPILPYLHKTGGFLQKVFQSPSLRRSRQA